MPSGNLRHEESTALELSASLKAIAEQTTMEFGMVVRCSVEGEVFSVPPAVSRELLMVVREAVYNSALHGNAQQIDIQVRYEPTRLALAVMDDGIGFDVDRQPAEGHYGIIGMRERMQRVSGDFCLYSAPNSGTRVDLAIGRAALLSKAGHARQWAMS